MIKIVLVLSRGLLKIVVRGHSERQYKVAKKMGICFHYAEGWRFDNFIAVYVAASYSGGLCMRL